MDTSSNGNQPFYYNDTNDEILVMCNGEIYNHNELIKEYDLHPHSHSDCEVIMELYKKKLDDFKLNWFRLTRLEDKYNKAKFSIEQQLAAYNNGKLTLNNEVILTVKAENNFQNAQVELTYLVGNVSWSPYYDIRVKDNKSNVQFFLKANIYQSTGEDWNNVKLKLTTANPAEGGVKPELQTNWLGFQQIFPKKLQRYQGEVITGGTPASYGDKDLIEDEATKRIQKTPKKV
jgi:uncharacterized protein (TIGR02231 family)